MISITFLCHIWPLKDETSSSSSSWCSWRVRHVILFLDPQDEVGPSISSSVVLCFFVLLVYIVVLVLVVCLCPSFVHVLATFPGTVLFPLLCMFCAPVFCLIHWYSNDWEKLRRHYFSIAPSCTTFIVLIAMWLNFLLFWDVAPCRVSILGVKQAKKTWQWRWR